MPTFSVQPWFFTPSPWSFLVVSRPGLGIAPVGRFVGFRAIPGLPKELSYSVRMFAIVFIGLSAQTGSFQWQPVKGSFTLRLQKGDGDNQVWWIGGEHTFAYQASGQVDANSSVNQGNNSP